MLFVEREVIEARPAAVGEAGGIHAGSLADAVDAQLGGGAEGVVTADHVVVVNDVIRVPAGRGDRGHVDDRAASAKRLLEIGIARDIRFHERHIRSGRLGRGAHLVNAHNAVPLRQRQFDDGAANPAAAAGDCDSHSEYPGCQLAYTACRSPRI